MSDSLFTPERIAAAHAETERLCRDLDITNADHIALWLEANIGDASLGYLAVRIIEAHEAALRASTDAAPVAWMLRSARALHTRSARQYGEHRVLCGQVFMSKETAGAAAERQTNRWRKIEAFPVYASAALSQQTAHNAAIEAAAKLVESCDQPRLTAYYRKKLNAIASAIRALAKQA